MEEKLKELIARNLALNFWLGRAEGKNLTAQYIKDRVEEDWEDLLSSAESIIEMAREDESGEEE